MFLELIAIFIAGIAAAGLTLLVNRFLGGRLPRWMAPVAAGGVMILVAVFSEYGWYSRTEAALPEGLVVAHTVEEKALYRPWTYVWPYVDRFFAVDTATVRTHPKHAGIKLNHVYFFGRWAPVKEMMVLTDCVAGKRAALADAISFEADGSIDGTQWVTVPPEDPILTTVCGTT